MNGARDGRRQIIMIKADWQLNELLYFSLAVDSKSQMFFNNNLKVEAYQGNVLLLDGLIVSSGPRWASHKMVGTNKKENIFTSCKNGNFCLAVFYTWSIPTEEACLLTWNSLCYMLCIIWYWWITDVHHFGSCQDQLSYYAVVVT